jgi:hypothetical protein
MSLKSYSERIKQREPLGWYSLCYNAVPFKRWYAYHWWYVDGRLLVREEI